MINVIIPTACRPAMLRTALASVANQTARTKIERVLVSENGGVRDSEAICAEFLELPIKYVFHSSPMEPLEHGRLLMQEYLQSEFTAMLHDDDWWSPWHLANALDGFANHADAVAYGSCHFVVRGESSMLNCSGNLFAWFGARYPAYQPIWELSRMNVLMAELLGTLSHYSTLVARNEALKKANYIYDLGNTFDNDRMLMFAFSKFGSLLYNPTPEVFVRLSGQQHCFQFNEAERNENMCRTTRWMLETCGKSHALVANTFAKLMSLCPAEAKDTLVALSHREWCIPELLRNQPEGAKAFL